MSQWTVPSNSALVFTFGPWEIAIEALADPSGQGLGDVLIVAYNDPGQGWDVVASISYQPGDIAAAGGMGAWLYAAQSPSTPSPFAQINAALKTFFNEKPGLPQITNATAYSAANLTEVIDTYFAPQQSPLGPYPQLVQTPFNANPALPGSPARPAPPTIISSTRPVIGTGGVTLTVNGQSVVYPLSEWNGATNPPTITQNGVVYEVIVQP